MPTPRGPRHGAQLQVFDCCYGYPADVWAAGVMMYWLLSGEFPFRGRNKMELARKVLAEQPAMSDGVWGQISSEAKDCLRWVVWAAM
jgi:serine/threonine protein kinase